MSRPDPVERLLAEAPSPTITDPVALSHVVAVLRSAEDNRERKAGNDPEVARAAERRITKRLER